MRRAPPRVATLLATLLLLGACRKATPPPDGEQATAVHPRAPGTTPPPPPPIQPLTPGPLTEEPARAVVGKLIEAHYDPQALGLQELTFTVELALASTGVRARATGRWARGAAPEVKLLAVTRKGQQQLAPPDSGLGGEIWTSLRLQTQRLLEGVGRGFLSQRLEAWRGLEGATRRREGKLELVFTEESGQTTVTVGEGYVVERVTHRSSKGVTRAMEYQHRREQGRNLVTGALYRFTLDAKADLPRRAAQVAAASDRSSFELTYGPVGRYLLPTRLRRVIPGQQEVIDLKLTFKRARP